MIIDGKKIAAEIVAGLKKKPKPDGFLAAFLVGENAASVSFLNQKKKIAGELGVDFRLYLFPEKTSQDELRSEILSVAEREDCGGIIVQLPLPVGVDAQRVLNAIPRGKDVDVLGAAAQEAFRSVGNEVLPPAAGVVDEILRRERQKTSERNIAVIGAGMLVGKPVASWAAGRSKGVFLLDKGDDLGVLKDADVVVCGAGVPGLVDPGMLKSGALVVDFGYGSKNGKISGDFAADAKYETLDAIRYTPTPGGTGPVLVAKLFENFFSLQSKNRRSN